MHDHCALHAELPQGLRHRHEKRRIVDADERIVGMGGVREGAEDVEDRAGAERLPDGSRKAHRGVVALREAEGKAGPLEHAEPVLGRSGDVDSERGQKVGGARRGRHAAVAVLGDPEACARRGERRHRRDVDRARAVAARADDLAHLEGGLREGPRGAQHRGGRSADLVGRLALHLQGGEKGRKLRLAHAACKNLGEEGIGFGSAQRLHAVEGFKSGIHFVLLSFPVGFFR